MPNPLHPPLEAAACERLDHGGPGAGLLHWREHFAPGEPGTVYLDANSIGPMPAAVPARLARLLDQGWRVARRRAWVEQRTGAELRHVGSFSFDPEALRGNIENPIGAAQVPVQTLEAQSPPTRQTLPSAQGGQAPPPQSWSVSEPFFMLSPQLAAAQTPSLQMEETQLEPTRQRPPLGQGLHPAAPQSLSVSRPLA